MDRDRLIIKDVGIHDLFHLFQLFVGHGLGVGEVESEPIRRDE